MRFSRTVAHSFLSVAAPGILPSGQMADISDAPRVAHATNSPITGFKFILFFPVEAVELEPFFEEVLPLADKVGLVA